MRFRDKLIAFFRDRYGWDRLNYALLILCFALSILRFVIGLFAKGLIGSIIVATFELLSWGLLLWAVFRTLSKNVWKRQKENETFTRLWLKIQKEAVLTKDRWKDRKTHVYRHCPEKGCDAVLRLPKKKGNHSVRCPKCGKLFDVRI